MTSTGRKRAVAAAGSVLVAAAITVGAYAAASGFGSAPSSPAAAPAPRSLAPLPSTPADATFTPRSAPTQSARPTPAPASARTPTPAPTNPRSTPAPKVLLARGAQGRLVRELQARLTQIGWFYSDPSGIYGSVTAAAVTGFQGKRGLPRTGELDTVTWARLLDMTHEPTAGDLLARPRPPELTAALDPRCLTGRALCIDKTTQRLRWVVDGQVLESMSVRFGSQFTPTREGQFSVTYKSRDHVSTIYHTAMPFAMFFSGGQAVHYSADFASRGYAGASHGCVNVRDYAGIAALFDQVNVGDKVVVYRA